MSVVFEHRNLYNDGNYPPIDDHDPTPDSDRFTDPTDSVVNDLATVAAVATFNATASPFVDTTDPRLDTTDHRLDPADHRLDSTDHRLDTTTDPRLDQLTAPSLSKENSPTATTPQRIKAIPKPDREVTRNLEGKFVCTWPGCSEDVKEFGRKCEWNKHMDKHDRPYKCAAEGCEKLPGFTYSGGLLRHEREVHNKHGGPKQSLNCPHPNCKRHTGKGFSRLENLNEHLRRVHTQNGLPGTAEGETDDAASDGAAAGQKRKRENEPEDTDLREEFKKMRQENEELRRQVAAQNQQTLLMMQKIQSLTEALQAQQSQTRIATVPMATPPMTAAPMIG